MRLSTPVFRYTASLVRSSMGLRLALVALACLAAAAPAAGQREPWSVNITGNNSGVQNGSFNVKIGFSSRVRVFRQGQVTVTNGSVTALSGEKTEFTATITPAASGTVTVSVAAGAVKDENSVTNAASNNYAVEADLDAPTVTVTGPTTAQAAAFNVTIAFSETVTGFEQGDVTVGNGSVTAFSGSGSSYTATITPAASGAVTVDVAASTAADTAGNGNTAASQYSVQADLDAPTVTITGPTDTQVKAFNVTIAFSESVTGFELGDVTVGNGSVTAFSGSGASYTATVTPVADGAVTVDVDASTAADTAGNGNTAASRYSVQAELNVAPVITNPGDKTHKQGETITAFGITVTDADGDTVTVTLSGLPGGLSYASGQVQGTVAAGAAAQAYTVTISADDGVNTAVTATFTITVSENAAPVITNPGDKTHKQGETITAFGITVTDADGDSVTVTLSGLPGGLSYASGQVQGTVAAGAAAQAYTVTISADDGVNTAVTATFTITVSENAPPVITNPGDKRHKHGETITAFGITVTDADGDTVTVTLSGLPGGLSYVSGQVQGTVADDAKLQDYTVTITADDGVNEAQTSTFTITVTEHPAKLIVAPVPVTDQPALTIADAWALEGETMTFTVTLDKAVAGGLTVTPTLSDGTAVEGRDYNDNVGAVAFAGSAGETQTFTVPTIQDSDDEGAETFTVGLAVSGTTEQVTATDTATGLIRDDDDATAPALKSAAINGAVLTLTFSEILRPTDTAGPAIRRLRRRHSQHWRPRSRRQRRREPAEVLLRRR